MKTVIAQNSLGRDKEMDLAEFTRRCVTDQRGICQNQEQFQIADNLFHEQKKLAEMVFNSLYEDQFQARCNEVMKEAFEKTLA